MKKQENTLRKLKELQKAVIVGDKLVEASK